MAGGTRGDVDLLQDALAGTPVSPIQTSLPGDWTCRTLKLGGLTDLTVYAPFACTITADGTGFVIDKTTGSQRLTGRIDLIEGAMILTATGFVADATPLPYAELPPENESDGTLWPIVGVVTQAEPDHVRILMPQPLLESDLDILDLRRVADDQSRGATGQAAPLEGGAATVDGTPDAATAADTPVPSASDGTSDTTGATTPAD
ncbi:protein of unknown function [Loktanella fryxellensis]|uniref:Uncharacterized protein n=1 Tax=Loktanella fryxellensis TaxID=245187 RepID=A0A1H8AD28_9RHOB|nr:protein of unknown function [Loktanella fryxellensis]